MENQQKNIAAKLIQVMENCGYIQKDSENKEQKYKYVSAAAVLEKVNAALVKARLVSIPEFSIVSEKEKATARGGIWQLVTVQCRLQLIDADTGESLMMVSLGTGTDPGDKAAAKAQTMALKYAWLTALNIETGDEPEADERTDTQEFLGAANPQANEICQLWQLLGWDASSLPGYMERRFSKPANQLTSAEYDVVLNEARHYYNEKAR